MNINLKLRLQLGIAITILSISFIGLAGVAITCPANMRNKCEHGQRSGTIIKYADPEALWEEELSQDLAKIELLPKEEQLEQLKKEYKKLRKKLHEIELKAEIKPEQK